MRYPILSLVFSFALPLAGQIGVFENAQDVGTAQPGRASFDRATLSYRISGGGANIWGREDGFHFLWRKVSGDSQLSADIRFEGAGKNAHRKVALMLRQSLEAGSPHVSAVVHGDGLTSLQFRSMPGGATSEVRADVSMPARLRILKQGTKISLLTAPAAGAPFQPSATTDFKLDGVYYLGIGICSHDDPVLETAVLSNVGVEHPPAPPLRSHIEIFDWKTRKTKRIHTEEGLLEAPNWSRDGKYLLVNARGRLFRVKPEGGKLEPLALPEGYRANNDHDLSPDGRLLAFSASTAEVPRSRVFVASTNGDNPRPVTENAPSYFHGWSPDGKYLAFVGQRVFNGFRAFELYRVPANGGPEERLTTAQAYDDGPEYSPDGKWIYFNSDRSGGWDIWRIPASGGGENDRLAERVTSDPGEDWFPHFSPNGKQMIFVTFPAGTIGHNGRMAGMQLRRLVDGKPEVLTTFTGGQGSINVNSWSPDGEKFAYVAFDLP
jgi:TolB protein